MSKIVLFGATSEIGAEIISRLAPGNSLVLAARRPEALSSLATACTEAGATAVESLFFDAADIEAMGALVEDIESRGTIDTAIAAFGVLGNQELAESNGGEVARILHTDFTAQAVLLTEVSTRMVARGSGNLVAFSSIAGARVRRPNYVYGSAKAGLDGFCQGMQDALQGTGVHLSIIRPGFVVGRMTAGMDPAPFSTTPPAVAQAVVHAIATNKTDVWVPFPLALLSRIMRIVPRWLWRRAPR